MKSNIIPASVPTHDAVDTSAVRTFLGSTSVRRNSPVGFGRGEIPLERSASAGDTDRLRHAQPPWTEAAGWSTTVPGSWPLNMLRPPLDCPIKLANICGQVACAGHHSRVDPEWLDRWLQELPPRDPMSRQPCGRDGVLDANLSEGNLKRHFALQCQQLQLASPSDPTGWSNLNRVLSFLQGRAKENDDAT